MDCISQKLQLFLVGLLLALPLPLYAAAGKVVIAAGDVYAVNAQNERRPLQRRADVFEGDTLITGTDGRLQLRFEDNAILALRADSQLRISEYHGASDTQPERVLMDLLGGGFRTISGSFGKSERDAYQVRTPNASIGIRGTHYEAVFESNTLSVGVYEGGIVLTNDQGSLNLGLDSEFVFAQVQAGNLPQGLLNPPANLNVPNTPQTDEEGEESDEEESDDGSDESDGDLNDDAANQSPDNNPNDTASVANDVGGFTADDFNFSALEDALEEELNRQDESESGPGVVELTEDEVTAINNNSTAVILVFSPSTTGTDGELMFPGGPVFGYQGITENLQDTNSPFFIAFSSQNLDEQEQDLVSPNLVIRPDDSSYADDNGSYGELGDIYWEEWNANVEQPTTALAGSDSGFGSGQVIETFYYITAEPTQAELRGTRFFSLGPDVGMLESTGFSSFGSNVSGYLEASFNSGVANGNLTFGDSDFVETWSLDFEGQVNGSVLNASLLDSSTYTVELQIPEIYEVAGSVNGVFTGESENIDFVGGFSAETVDTDNNDEVYGVFVMEEYSGQEIGVD
ncbi:FecR family protein [Saccharospirillum mangrovi]|uniref:FecR family protein n=1 Tax=Saccharospirillum mangrovi TaxID=2161747 RepID=UPI000D3816A1|nr:FecR family protein [Saccharospirillum mangrovi]